jgi:cytosine/adenosine deaminase-related metal-dependent hydrolase
MHLLETVFQKSYAKKRSGSSAVRYLKDIGLLGPRMTLGHGVWMTNDDLDLIAETETRICHNCSSNMRLSSGIAPLNAMLGRGIEVAIGIDEAGLNDDRDMLQEMRLVLRAHRTPGLANIAPTATEVFRMATAFGAHTTGFGSQIGVAREGKAADLVLLDWNQVSYPHLDSDTPVIDALIHRARSQGVEAVMINGEMVLENGKFNRIDEAGALEELARRLRNPLTNEEVRLRSMSKRLIPHIRRYYDNYLDETPLKAH